MIQLQLLLKEGLKLDYFHLQSRKEKNIKLAHVLIEGKKKKGKKNHTV